MTSRDVIVVGGGPAGSTAAAALARAGHDVLLLEAGEHPRPHVGESLLPGIIPILDAIGVLPRIEAAGFWAKTGSTLWNWGKTPRWDLWFHDSDAYDHAWLVDRSRFDAILFDHAGRSGAEVRARAVAREVITAGDRVAGVRWRSRDGGAERLEEARFVLDATGQTGLLARARGRREPIEGLQHQAMWAHYEQAARLPPPRGHQALFVAQPTRWWWCFPLAEGKASVGVVQLDAQGRRSAPRRDFDALLAACPELLEVLGKRARRCTPVRHERDWSYRSRRVAGPGWMSVGDAAGFIDPVLSTGVMLALHSAWDAARTLGAILGGEPEAQALSRYTEHHAEMFEDLLRMVRFYYQQNLHRDDYFWESKRILTGRDALSPAPQKAFVLLTSGLVANLALDDATKRRDSEHRARIEHADDEAPRELDAPERFVCIHLRHRQPPPRSATLPAEVEPEGSALFVLVEPAAAHPGAPALFRTPSLHINAIAPRHGNDPISDPRFAPVLHQLHRVLAPHDDPSGDLTVFWHRARGPLRHALADLPEDFELVRVFGE